MFDNNIHYIMKELDSIYNVVVENLGKELLNKEIKHLEYEPKMDRININNFIFIRLIVQNEDDHKEIFYDIYVLDENGNDTEHSMINVQRPFKRLVDKLDVTYPPHKYQENRKRTARPPYPYPSPRCPPRRRYT